jgi:hypothetical protein
MGGNVAATVHPRGGHWQASPGLSARKPTKPTEIRIAVIPVNNAGGQNYEKKTAENTSFGYLFKRR